MDYLPIKLFEQAEAHKIRDGLLSDKENWYDGKRTAMGNAAKVKDNQQLEKTCPIFKKYEQIILQKMYTTPILRSYALPKSNHGTIFSRTGVGQGYGLHQDNPYMATGRADLSFTLFLQKKDSYEGGELFMKSQPHTKLVKLEAGSAIIYPTDTLHKVNEVTEGERIVCVGWIHSNVPSHEDRVNLLNIDNSIGGIIRDFGRNDDTIRIQQSYSNLMRRLGD